MIKARAAAAKRRVFTGPPGTGPASRRNLIDANETMHKALIWLMLSSLGAAAVPAALAEDLKTYVWKDADGKIHYGDQPPPSQPFSSTATRFMPWYFAR